MALQGNGQVARRKSIRTHLPHASEDYIIFFHSFYFISADLMYDHYISQRNRLQKTRKPSELSILKYQTYAELWLSLLSVNAEGFQEERMKKFYNKKKICDLTLNVRWHSIQYQISQGFPQLKRYRNSTFHLQNNLAQLSEKRNELFSTLEQPALLWANSLHLEMKAFFSLYRVISTVTNLVEIRAK